MSARSDTRRTWLSQPPTLRSAARSTSTIVVDARPLYLQHHAVEPGVGGVARAKPGPVRLPEGCCCDRCLLDRGEQPLQRHAQLSFGEGSDRGERNRRHLVLQPLEFLGDLGRQHVEPGGQELSDFDHEAAEVHRQRMEALREAPHPLRPGALGNPHQPDAGEEQLEPPGHREMPRGEAQDAAVTGPVVPGAGYRSCPVPANRRHPASALGEDRVQPAARVVEHRHGLLHLLRRPGASHLGGGLCELDARLGQRREPRARRRTRRLPGR